MFCEPPSSVRTIFLATLWHTNELFPPPSPSDPPSKPTNSFTTMHSLRCLSYHPPFLVLYFLPHFGHSRPSVLCSSATPLAASFLYFFSSPFRLPLRTTTLTSPFTILLHSALS